MTPWRQWHGYLNTNLTLLEDFFNFFQRLLKDPFKLLNDYLKSPLRYIQEHFKITLKTTLRQLNSTQIVVDFKYFGKTIQDFFNTF